MYEEWCWSNNNNDGKKKGKCEKKQWCQGNEKLKVKDKENIRDNCRRKRQ